MKKKLFSLALALVMVLALLPTTAFAEDATPVEIGNITLSDVVVTDKYETALDLFGADGSPANYEFLYNLGDIGFWYDDIEEYGYADFWCYIVPEDAAISLHTTEETPRYDIYVYTLEEVEGWSNSSRGWQATCIDGFDATLADGESETDYSTTKEYIEGYDPEFDLLWIGTGADDYILVWFGGPDAEPATTPEPEPEPTTEPDPVDEPEFAFTDVPSWFETAVAWAVEQGITNGYGSSTYFGSGIDCLQTQILTFLWRAQGEPPAGEAPITVLSFYQEAVNWAYEKGFIDDSFDSEAKCTRAEAVQYIWLALDCPEPLEAASVFTDVAADASYAGAVAWALENGVTDGYGGIDTFAPDRVCSRGQIAAFLYRAFN